jgi:multiple sugar transport system substrate-binding protein
MGGVVAREGPFRAGRLGHMNRSPGIAFLSFPLCALVLFSGCSTTPKPETTASVTIEVGALSVPDQARGWFASQIASFQQAHPNIKVMTAGIPDPIRPIEGQLRDTSRLAENVVGIQGTIESETALLVDKGLLVPIENFMGDGEFKKSDFSENAWTSVTYNGKTWGVPWMMDSLWIYCDWPLFEAAGIKEPPRTWDQFWDCLQRLTTDRNGDGKIDQWGMRISPTLGLEFLLWLSRDLQDGVHYVKNGSVSFDDPATRKNIEYVQKLMASPYLYKGDQYTFALGDNAPARSAMYLITNFNQHVPELVEANRRFAKNTRLRAIPIPTDGPQVNATGLRLYLAVRKSTPEKEKASWEFIKWINRADAPLSDHWNGYPCAPVTSSGTVSSD